MTPQERFEYKQVWLNRHPSMVNSVDVPSDLKYECMDWCRTHLQQHEYEYKPFTGPYYDTWLFEYMVDANCFKRFLEERK